MAEEEPVIGIDLGTTNSVVATVQGKAPRVLESRAGGKLTPSVVALTSAGKQLVGQLAKRQANTNPRQTVRAAKRLIGRKFSSAEVKEALRYLPYEVVCGEHDDTRVRLGGRDVALPELSAMILKELKADAEAHFGRPVSKAVITVPAHFNDGQRQATRDAGVIAGLDVLRIINEPTAAALAYGFGTRFNGKIAVYDLGGGTFDLSVLEATDGVFEVIATGGDTFLGGEDFDNRLIDHLAGKFLDENGIDVRQNVFALQRLKESVERERIALSTGQEVFFHLPFIASKEEGGAALHLQASLSRAQLESMTVDLIDRSLAICDQVLREARVQPMDLLEVILVGGMTHMPLVALSVEAYFKRAPCREVDPLEVVAVGAAVQAQALLEPHHELVLLDVTPLSLGVAVAGGYVRKLIPKNTTVPTSTTELFHTSKDHQTSVKILVLQGESEVAHENELLGEFTLTGLREARRGEVVVEVTFAIDADGLVQVSAKDRETGAQQSITVTPSGGLTRPELDTILDARADQLLEARADAELDDKREALKKLLGEVEQLSSQLKQSAVPLAGEAAAKGEQRLEAARRAVASGTLAEVTASVDQLERVASVFRAAIDRG